MLFLIADAFDASLPERLAAFGEVTEDLARLAEAHVVLIRSKTKMTRELIEKAPHLKLIIRGGVGLDNVDKAFAAEKGILVRNTPKASAIAVAELAFCLMLAVPNRLVEAHQSMKEGRWEKKSLKRTELYGKTLCLLGLGNIATEVAKRARAFGMKVVAYDPFVKESEWAELQSSIEHALRPADYVSLHTPLNPDTLGLLHSNTFALMKDGVVIINTGRANCVARADLMTALESGKVACYATDVWPTDPPTPDYPVLKHPNVLMTPHIGANSKENLLRIGDEVVALLTSLKEEGKL
jgi:D-3-phosphoglycerate dehydrogenase